MENFKIEPSKKESSAEIKEQAVLLSNKLNNQNADFVHEIKEIIDANPNLRAGLNKYSSSTEEALAEFEIRPWGNGNIDYRNIKNIPTLIDANTEYTPNLEVLNSCITEWEKRTNEIKTMIQEFNGDENQAFDLIQSIHKEKVLKTLNEDQNPILDKNN